MLPGFDCSTHAPGQPVRRVWMGRGRDYLLAGKTSDWAAPCEPIEAMGCPGAWYRTDFVRSLDRYYRRRAEGGNRIENPALSQTDDPLIHEAVQMREAFEDSAQAHHVALVHAEHERARKART